MRRRKIGLITTALAASLLIALAAVTAALFAFDRYGGRESLASLATENAPDAGMGVPDVAGVKQYPGGEILAGLGDDAGEADGERGVAAPGELTSSIAGTHLLRTADLGLVVPGHDVSAAVARVTALTGELRGYVLYSFTGKDHAFTDVIEDGDEAWRQSAEDGLEREGVETATVTVRVPEAVFETALRRFARLGEVEYRRTSTEDVSDQMVDLQARLRHARAVERRLLRFLEASDTIREMLAVQDRLDQVQLEIEQLTAQIESLREVTTFATISVGLRAEGDPRPVIGAGGGVWDNFMDAWRLVGRSARLLLLALAAALPFVIVLGGAAAAFWYGARRLGRKRSGSAGAEGTA
jgi:hypothetical protein